RTQGQVSATGSWLNSRREDRELHAQKPDDLCRITDVRDCTSGYTCCDLHIRPPRGPMKTDRRRLVLAGMLIALTTTPAAAGPVRIYITDSAADTVHVIDAGANKVVQVIRGIETPHGVTFSPDGARVYISNESTGSLDVVDRKSGRIIKKVALSGH